MKKYWIFLLLVVACKPKHLHAVEERYTCPMHPEIIRDKPGKCPICSMDLVKVGDIAITGIVLTENQIKLANLSTQVVEKKQMSAKTVLNGTVKADEEQTTVVSSRAAGRIERLFFKEQGLAVSVGDPLYEIYSETLLTLQQEYLIARRQAVELKESHFQSILSAAEKKLFLLGMTQQQLEAVWNSGSVSSRILFRAPTTGVIARIDVAEGQFVTDGALLYRIEKLDKVWIEAELYGSERELVHLGDILEIKVAGSENESAYGKVIFLSPEFRQGNQIITLRMEVGNLKKKFIPGMQANVTVSRAVAEKAIVLPGDAVIHDQSGAIVWVRDERGSFNLRSVATGDENADDVEIIAGLHEGDNVVVTGAYLLYSEMILKHGGIHQHSN